MTEEELDQLFERIQELSGRKQRYVLAGVYGTISSYVTIKNETGLRIMESLEGLVAEQEGKNY